MNSLDSLLARIEQVPLDNDTRQRHLSELLRAQSAQADRVEEPAGPDRSRVEPAGPARRRSLAATGLTAAAVVAVAGGSWLMIGPSAPTTISPGSLVSTAAAGPSERGPAPKEQPDPGPSILTSSKAVQMLASALGIDQQRAADAAEDLVVLADGNGGRLDPQTPGFVDIARSLGVSADRLEQALFKVKIAMAPVDGAAKGEAARAGGGPVEPKVAAAKAAAVKDESGKSAAGTGDQNVLSTPAAALQLATMLGISVEKATTIAGKLTEFDRIVPTSGSFAAVADAAGVTTDALQKALVQLKTGN